MRLLCPRWLLPLQHDFLQIRREAALRLTDVAKEVIHNGIGIGNLPPLLS